MSSGGLVSGLSGLTKSTTFQWFGWTGIEIPDDEVEPLSKRLKDEYNAFPVLLDDEMADRYYNGFSSKVPLDIAEFDLIGLCRFHPMATVSLPPW